MSQLIQNHYKTLPGNLLKTKQHQMTSNSNLQRFCTHQEFNTCTISMPTWKSFTYGFAKILQYTEITQLNNPEQNRATNNKNSCAQNKTPRPKPFVQFYKPVQSHYFCRLTDCFSILPTDADLTQWWCIITSNIYCSVAGITLGRMMIMVVKKSSRFNVASRRLVVSCRLKTLFMSRFMVK